MWIVAKKLTHKESQEAQSETFVPLVLLCGCPSSLTFAVAAISTEIAATRMLQLPVAFGADADHV